MRKIIVNPGDTFGRLTILKEIEADRYRTFQCKCICGTIKLIKLDSLRLGKTVSCGCFNRERIKTVKHGYSKRNKRDRVYTVWASMKRRCQNPKNKSYKTYGGRGITVCDEWNSFENFIKDMGSPKFGESLDRIDNSKGYFKENCRWATMWEQGANKRNNRLFTYDGKTQILAQWSRETGIDWETLSSRIKSGYSPSEVINTPKYARRK